MLAIQARTLQLRLLNLEIVIITHCFMCVWCGIVSWDSSNKIQVTRIISNMLCKLQTMYNGLRDQISPTSSEASNLFVEKLVLTNLKFDQFIQSIGCQRTSRVT